jgi:hypothetical protein
MVIMAMVMGRPATITEMATRMAVITGARAMEMGTRPGVPTAAITPARTTEIAFPPIQE